ncbi:BON domain-containing protein [Iningainema tapete]|uniref:BON domain-containing protein n=1 Tax=Iningainema tapete BLCC-T55 TaxID=2748662 RepID=A0A8J6XF75_9CYAN|nr:BON domain-containing protein [Iningainema tapete]MBD2772733.1 BON domain-containing protein [Iningainema tapete BLCC-T55]
MKKLAPVLITCLLVFGAVGCQNAAKTTADAPTSTNTTPNEAPSPEATQAALNDAQSVTRRRQLNADIRANEQRNNQFNSGSGVNRSENALASEVRSKLEANIPKGNLTVEAKDDGTVTVAGTVTNKQELAKIERLAKEIKGVKNVVVKAIVSDKQS